ALMSWGDNVNAAWNVRGLPSGRHKAALVYLATRADGNGGNAYLSYKDIATALECSRRRAITIVGDLVKAGFVKRIRGWEGTGGSMPNMYALSIAEPRS